MGDFWIKLNFSQVICGVVMKFVIVVLREAVFVVFAVVLCFALPLPEKPSFRFTIHYTTFLLPQTPTNNIQRFILSIRFGHNYTTIP